METEAPIKRRKDGSIDTAYYMAKGRNARSHQAHKMGGNMWHRLMKRLKFRFSFMNSTESRAHSH